MEKIVSTAKVIDGTLILTLPDAIRPVVWQMQLGQTKSSALEVREQNGTWVLFLKTPRMDVMEIAPFETKAAAVHALLAVSKAMEKAQGQLSAGSANYPVPAVIPSCGRFPFLCRLLKTVGYALLTIGIVVLILWGLLSLLSGGGTPSPDATVPQASELTPGAASSEIAPAGQTVPADDFLNAPR